jgi:hypothetical protein
LEKFSNALAGFQEGVHFPAQRLVAGAGAIEVGIAFGGIGEVQRRHEDLIGVHNAGGRFNAHCTTQNREIQGRKGSSKMA